MQTYYETYRYKRGQRDALPLKGWQDDRMTTQAYSINKLVIPQPLRRKCPTSTLITRILIKIVSLLPTGVEIKTSENTSK